MVHPQNESSTQLILQIFIRINPLTISNLSLRTFRTVIAVHYSEFSYQRFFLRATELRDLTIDQCTEPFEKICPSGCVIPFFAMCSILSWRLSIVVDRL
jgi:hypothetical protein